MRSTGTLACAWRRHSSAQARVPVLRVLISGIRQHRQECLCYVCLVYYMRIPARKRRNVRRRSKTEHVLQKQNGLYRINSRTLSPSLLDLHLTDDEGGFGGPSLESLVDYPP